MPASSKSQQRLFGMVHAYNKGEFHGSRSLRRMVSDLSKRISGEDARHFAETPHAGLPERKEKRVCEKRASTPSDEDLRRMYDVSTGGPWYAPWPDGAYDDSTPPDDADPAPSGDSSEKKAQVMLRPDEVQAMYSMLEPRIEAMADRVSDRSRKRRSFLYNVVGGTARGALVGATIGGLGAGALGVGFAKQFAGRSPNPPTDLNARLVAAGAKCGLWGAGSGALVGSLTGLGLGVLNSIRE